MGKQCSTVQFSDQRARNLFQPGWPNLKQAQWSYAHSRAPENMIGFKGHEVALHNPILAVFQVFATSDCNYDIPLDTENMPIRLVEHCFA